MSDITYFIMHMSARLCGAYVRSHIMLDISYYMMKISDVRYNMRCIWGIISHIYNNNNTFYLYSIFQEPDDALHKVNR